jgi:hypothetical protein
VLDAASSTYGSYAQGLGSAQALEQPNLPLVDRAEAAPKN